jgi:quercetin dioxygenase-like cupin family protein
MRKENIIEKNGFRDDRCSTFLVHDTPYLKILSFNFRAGQELPLHAHDAEGQVSIAILAGEGEFLAEGGALPARAGDVLVCDIARPHGLRAASDLRALVTIAPPI